MLRKIQKEILTNPVFFGTIKEIERNLDDYGYGVPLGTYKVFIPSLQIVVDGVQSSIDFRILKKDSSVVLLYTESEEWIIIGVLPKSYPENLPGNQLILDEADFGYMHPFSNALIKITSDGMAELSGRIPLSGDRISLKLGGNQYPSTVFSITYNTSNNIISFTKNKLLKFVVNVFNVASKAISFATEFLHLISQKVEAFIEEINLKFSKTDLIGDSVESDVESIKHEGKSVSVELTSEFFVEASRIVGQSNDVRLGQSPTYKAVRDSQTQFHLTNLQMSINTVISALMCIGIVLNPNTDIFTDISSSSVKID